MKIKFSCIIGIMVLIFSCSKDYAPLQPSPPPPCCGPCIASGNTPVITYDSFQQYAHDSLVLKFNFCDKDGDIGLGMFDTSGILKNGNLWLIYYYKDSTGNWSPWDSNPMPPPQMDTTIIKYRVPALPAPPVSSAVTIGGAPIPVTVFLKPSQILEGEIRIRMNGNYYVPSHHEIKYEIVMYDKALHKSNMISTASIFP